jgi:hypothetical protein
VAALIAVDTHRRERNLTWAEAAAVVGCSTATLTGLVKARHATSPQVMDILAWLAQPAANFVTLRVLRTPEDPRTYSPARREYT